MEAVEVLHMVEGEGETSYASNSSLQKKAIVKAKPIVEQALVDLYSSILPQSLAVVDFGCSSGPNAFLVAGDIIGVIGETCRRLGRAPPEVQYFLNDLSGNDFTTLFRHLASFQEKLEEGKGKGEGVVPFYATGVPGSFYKRLFPKGSIHFAHSSCSIHWLSQVPRGLEGKSDAPLNKQNIYLSTTSPFVVFQLYLEQFQRDFTQFLKLRSEEIILNGCMVLVLFGRENSDPLYGGCQALCKLLADALNDMAFEGIIKQEKVDSFNLPLYAPSIQELRTVIYGEGSFDITRCEAFELNWDPTDDDLEDFVADKLTSGQNIAKSVRVVTESMFTNHFGKEIINDLFSKFAQNVAIHLAKEKTKYFNLVISLKKSVQD